MTRHRLEPYRLRAADAALFCGDSVSTFYAKVKSGDYPKAAWKEGASAYWDPAELRAAMDERRLVESDAAPAPKRLRKLDELRNAG